ncbi:MAG: ATP-dependent 6-phosphofructokinase [Acidimicrobiia bacterium]|nr:ATP-dependent 6-phosphofructokinase [Acidimicrobiia bacterium]MYC58218.1 ATP-dependent 6-phosphofructokinase [Acidimicrobiia bacterium]MYG93638.1 ATP-dependent 6-phosphofructokinase [Acidimicrobiia bacterium]MYI30311.1 ATP-dependent 6-phosphofructokinase [Acidimicrobiia bacterium]
MRVGVLTGGGDCPGLNAVIRAIVRKAERHYQDSIIGFKDGWSGVLEGDFIPLDVNFMRGSLPRGGTVLGTSRVSPRMYSDGFDKVRSTMESTGIDALIVIGGEGTLSAAASVQEAGAAQVVGVPKTIDNDIALTEQTFGFDTAVSIATSAIDRLHTTAESHDRVMVVEVMGRHVGHIATWAGIAGGATLTLIPEHPFDIQAVAETIMRRHRRGRWASIVVVAEGALPAEGTLEIAEPEVDEFGHKKLGGIGHVVASEIGARTGFDTRVTVLGHIQRGGTPTAFDRVLCSRYGIAAIDAVHAHKWGSMVAYQAGGMVTVRLVDAIAEAKPVSSELYEVARAFFA